MPFGVTSWIFDPDASNRETWETWRGKRGAIYNTFLNFSSVPGRVPTVASLVAAT